MPEALYKAPGLEAALDALHLLLHALRMHVPHPAARPGTFSNLWKQAGLPDKGDKRSSYGRAIDSNSQVCTCRVAGRSEVTYRGIMHSMMARETGPGQHACAA